MKNKICYFIPVMYSMCAFGPVCGFLLGAYLLSYPVDTFSYDVTMMSLGNLIFMKCGWPRRVLLLALVKYSYICERAGLPLFTKYYSAYIFL